MLNSVYRTANDLTCKALGWGHHNVTPKLIDRETGKEIGEPEPYHGEVELGLFYSDMLGRWWLWTWVARAYFRYRGKVNGWLYDRPCSAQDIQKFAKTYHVNLEDVEKPADQYHTINEFFTRKLKPGVRPIASPQDPSISVCPADSRVLVFDKVSIAKSLWIKGNDFSIQKLLTSRYDANDWDNCPLAISRLAPVDYHRLHSPVTGTVKTITKAGSTLYAVEAAAVRSPIDIYGDNERAIVEFDSPAFGTVMFCIIGASQVGSCNITVKEGQEIRKGDEVGFFCYGGSATVTLFKPHSITWDDDLWENSRHLWETKCKYGQSWGRATGSRNSQA
jgi:phosphatidylserine decarboxylase